MVFVWVTRWSPLGVGRDEYAELFTCHVANKYDWGFSLSLIGGATLI